MTGTEETQCLYQTKLSPPSSDRHAGLGNEEAFERATAGPRNGRQIIQARRGGLGQQVGEAPRPRVPGLGQPERGLPQFLQLIKQDVNDVCVTWNASIKGFLPGDNVENELAQERCDVDHLKLGGHRSELGPQMEGTDCDPSMHLCEMELAIGDPHGPIGRNDPGASLGLDAHDSRGRVEELVPPGH